MTFSSPLMIVFPIFPFDEPFLDLFGFQIYRFLDSELSRFEEFKRGGRAGAGAGGQMDEQTETSRRKVDWHVD